MHHHFCEAIQLSLMSLLSLAGVFALTQSTLYSESHCVHLNHTLPAFVGCLFKDK